MKSLNVSYLISICWALVFSQVVAEKPFYELFRLRKGLDSICGERKWLIRYTTSTSDVQIWGYCKSDGRIFSATGKLDPKRKSKDFLDPKNFTSLEVIVSNDQGIVRNASLLNGKCYVTYMPYDLYLSTLNKLTSYHYESKLEACPIKYQVVDEDPTIVQAADKMEAEVADVYRRLIKWTPPIMGFEYSLADDGYLHIGRISDRCVAEYAGLKEGDVVSQIFLDYKPVAAKDFKEQMTKDGFTLLTFVAFREERPRVIDMYFPTILERRLLDNPPKDAK
jgi:hypothetical protein